MANPEPAPTTKLPPPSPTAHGEPPTTAEPATLAWKNLPRPVSAVPADLAITGYEFLGELGRGGMGVVFKARQIALNRVVALKMILSGSLSGADEIQRFRTEAEAAARVQHANIVGVFEVGEADGRCYFTMEFVEGPSLAQRLKEGPMPGRQAAQCLAVIARAVHHAHRSGFLHRDLKPSNILLDAEGQPHITDFGLAKRLGVDASQTQTGAVVGTPSYMPPEQASGRVHDLGPASDVYSLGAILYEMLTGRPPFHAESTMETLRHVLEHQPAPPRLLHAGVDRDLETICLKCLEKDPAARYPSAQELAGDLDRYVRGDSIQARTLNVLDRIGRTLERDQYLDEFRPWGKTLLVFAGIVLVEHLVVFALTVHGPPYPRVAIVVARFVQFALLALLFWRQRRATLLPTTTAERQLWSIWIGYLLACAAASAGHRLMVHTGKLPDNFLTLYPLWSVLTGLAFFAMGSNYWGRFYVCGVAFFAVGALMAWHLDWAVLMYGLAWSATLAQTGLHLLRQGTEDRGQGTVNRGED